MAREAPAMPRLIVALLVLTLLVAGSLGPAGSQESPPFVLGAVTKKWLSPDTLEVRLTATTVRALPLAPEVPIPTSRLRFVGPVRMGALQEDSLLGSLYQVDLNGNGILDQLPVHLRGDGVSIDQLVVKPLGTSLDGPQEPFREDGEPRRYLLDPDRPEFMVLFYQADPPVMGLDLQWHGFRPSVESFPSPCLQLAVFEPCGQMSGPGDLPDDPTFDLKFDGDPEQRETYFWEPWIFERLGRPAQWVRSRWVCIPLPATPGQEEIVFQMTTSGETDLVGLFAQVDYALQPGQRLRGQSGVTLLREGLR